MTHRDAVFASLCSEWRAIRQRSQSEVARWEHTRLAMASEEDRLRESGRWLHGRSDYLGIAGRGRDELTHSRMIAWLMDPCGRHGLGTTFLAAFISDCHRFSPTIRLSQARTYCEQVLANGRLDIVVHAPGLHLVVENKVDAEEGGQCFYYSQHLPADACCVLLSPDGRAPVTPVEGEAVRGALPNRFVPMRYRRVAELLRDSLAGSDQDAPSRRVALDYLRTLETEFYDPR